jgi:hypothetical protein
MKRKRKVCPLLVQSDTTPSLTVNGETYTRTYFLPCIGEDCVAYHALDGYCKKWQSNTMLRKDGE